MPGIAIIFVQEAIPTPILIPCLFGWSGCPSLQSGVFFLACMICLGGTCELIWARKIQPDIFWVCWGRAHTFESDWSLQNITLVLLECHIAITELENEAILMDTEMRVEENPDSGDIIWASGLRHAWSITSTRAFLLTLDFCLGFCHFQRKGPN